MRVLRTRLPGLRLWAGAIHRDDRGWLREVWTQAEDEALGIGPFVQTNVSASRKGVLRGMHMQAPRMQAKRVTVLHGAVFDVAVDLRAGPHFGEWEGFELSAESGEVLYVPEGFAHGFLALTDEVIFSYDLSAPYDPAGQLRFRFDDPQVGIRWPLEPTVLSAADASAPLLSELEL